MAPTYLELALALVKRLESCKLAAYRDSAGIPTIGYGRTAGVRMGQVCSQDQADTWLRQDLAVADDRLTTCIFGHEGRLTAHQHAALVSFVYNAGAQRGWTIWRLINTGILAGVPDQLKLFDKAHVGGKVVAVRGLDNRRAAEIACWNTPDV
jgi:GH24 family phage-related lysozyme (muramidase)